MNALEISTEDFHRLAANNVDLCAGYLRTLDPRSTFPQTTGEESDRLFDLEKRVALDLDRQIGRGPETLDSLRDRAGRPQMVVFDEYAVIQPEAMVSSPAHGDSVLLERAQARGRLPRVEDRDAGSSDSVHVPLRERRNAGEPREEVERRPLSGEDRPLRGRHARDRAALDKGSLLDQRVQVEPVIERAEHGLRRTETTDDSVLSQDEHGRPKGLGVDGRLGRHIPLTDVFRECRVDGTFEEVGRYSHVSSVGSEPGRRTMCPANPSAVEGWSTRKCEPRLSSR